MDKYDVYEHTAEAGGYQGTRFYTTSSKQSKESRSTSPIFKLIAEGVSDDEAQKLTSCTPEICRLLAAVEEAAYNKQTGKVDRKLLQYQITTMAFGIRSDRADRATFLEEVKPGFSIFTPPDESTERNRVIIALKKAFPNPTGSLGDLTAAGLTIGITVANVLFPTD